MKIMNESEIKKIKENASKAMSELGRIGGRVTALRQGREHFVRIAKISARVRREKAKAKQLSQNSL